MSESDPIRVFVAHAFSAHADYLRVFEYLESRPNFYYRNCSSPDVTLPSRDGEAIKSELRRQIGSAEIVVIPVNLLASEPVLAAFQVNTAKSLKKPVLAVRSAGDPPAMSKSMLEHADEIVDWNDRVMVEAIRRLARNDGSGLWETVEFKLD